MSLSSVNPTAQLSAPATTYRADVPEEDRDQGFSQLLGQIRGDSAGTDTPSDPARPAATHAQPPADTEDADPRAELAAIPASAHDGASGSALANMVHDLTRQSRAVAAASGGTQNQHAAATAATSPRAAGETAAAARIAALPGADARPAARHPDAHAGRTAMMATTATARTGRTEPDTASRPPRAGATEIAADSEPKTADTDTLESAANPSPRGESARESAASPPSFRDVAALATTPAPGTASTPAFAPTETGRAGAMATATMPTPAARPQSTSPRDPAWRPATAAINNERGAQPVTPAVDTDTGTPASPSAATRLATADTPQSQPTAGPAIASATAEPASWQPPRSPGAIMPFVAAPVGTPQWGAALGEQLITLGRGEDGIMRHAELRLDPPHLGPLRVSIQLNGEQASAAFISAHPAVRTALEAALPQLQQTLAEAGINLGHTSVGEHTAQDTQAQGQQHAGNRNQDESTGELTIADAPAPIPRAPRGLVDTFA